MKLQILVPHYDEELHEIEPLLDSIAIQQSVDFSEVGVIIAHDGDRKNDGLGFAVPFCWSDWTPRWAEIGGIGVDEGEKAYPFRIEIIDTGKHVGVSAARNAALDAATADYVMFCDADDMFLTVNALYTIFQLIETQHFDTLVSCFTEEQLTRDVQEKMAQGAAILEATFGPAYKPAELPEFMYLPHEMDSTFVHGKVHRRQYLIDKGIRFDPRLTVHEDSYFNILAQQLCDPEKAKYWPQPFYLWKWRDTSVCRHDPQYILKTFNNMLETTDALIDQFVRRGYEEKAKLFTAQTVYDTYYTMSLPDWVEVNNAEYRASTERKFREWFEKHRSKWESLDPQVRVVISEQQRQRHVAEGMLMEAVTLDQWLDGITEG